MKKYAIIFIICILFIFSINIYALEPPAMTVDVSKNVITSNNALLSAKLSNSKRELISRFELLLYKYNEENERQLVYVGEKILNTYGQYVCADFNVYEDFDFKLLPNTKYAYTIRAIMGDGFSADGYSNGHNFTTLIDDTIIQNEDIIETDDDWKYFIKDGYAHIVKYNGSDTDLIVPSVINDVPVKVIDDYALAENDNLKSIVISEGITHIGAYAFYDSSAINEVILPSSLIDIEYDDNVGYSCFLRCNSLKNINVDSNNSVFSSDDGILYNKDKTRLLFYSINRSATDFVVPYGVKEIGKYAFIHQRKLDNLIIPETVEYIHPYNYIIFSYMQNINVDENNKFYSSEDGILYNKDKTELILLPAGKKIESFHIPDTVKIIGDYAFYNCIELNSLILSDGIEKIGDYSFYGCQNMTCFEIPATVTSIGDNAFGYCFGLEKIKFLGEKPNNLNRDIFSDAAKSFVLSYDLAYESSWTDYIYYAKESFGKKIEEPSTTAIEEIKIKKAKIKSAKNSKKKSIILKIKTLNNVDKYRIQYSTNKKFKNKKSKTSKKVKVVLKKLELGKTYYIRVRGINGDIKGKWSNVKKVKIKK